MEKDSKTKWLYQLTVTGRSVGNTGVSPAGDYYCYVQKGSKVRGVPAGA